MSAPDAAADLDAAIAAECDRLGIALPARAAPRLAAFARSLWAWNERLNLTRHTDVGLFVSRDVADAAAIAPHLARSERLLDVGTGGGMPGVLLAILRPDLRIELCDSVAKKARATAEIVRETGLALPVHAAAGQALVVPRAAGPDRFDTLVIRAVAPLVKLLGWFEPCAGAYGRLLVVKGPRWEEERAEARARGLERKVVARPLATWPLPGGTGTSVLVEVRARAG